MHIVLNGQPHAIAAGQTLLDLLRQLDLLERRVAVEVNREIVPRSQHADRLLQADDVVEIVHAIGGG